MSPARPAVRQILSSSVVKTVSTSSTATPAKVVVVSPPSRLDSQLKSASVGGSKDRRMQSSSWIIASVWDRLCRCLCTSRVDVGNGTRKVSAIPSSVQVTAYAERGECLQVLRSPEHYQSIFTSQIHRPSSFSYFRLLISIFHPT